MLLQPSSYRPSQRRRRVSVRRDSCNWACTFHPFVHGTTHVGAVSPHKADQLHDEATGGKKDERVFLRADKSVPYGELMQGMNLLRSAGYLKVALVGLEQ